MGEGSILGLVERSRGCQYLRKSVREGSGSSFNSFRNGVGYAQSVSDYCSKASWLSLQSIGSGADPEENMTSNCPLVLAHVLLDSMLY